MRCELLALWYEHVTGRLGRERVSGMRRVPSIVLQRYVSHSFTCADNCAIGPSNSGWAESMQGGDDLDVVLMPLV